MTGADIDIRMVANPYDFANPVRSRERFTGRQKQLDDIRYYLDHARRAEMAVNLALMGARASGKTSLLNMIELEARDRGFCIARIDLNESDADSPLAFFFKVFDCVFNAACQTPDPVVAGGLCFGGRTGRTFETYLDMISAYAVPDDRAWCPFLFPIQYAKAMASGTVPRISEHILKQDLSRVQTETARPIAMLFDECNVLSGNRVLLEMIRNLFMNMPSYMLVFAGTYALFPVMDDVFSPIVRQFKKIDIDSFTTSDETEQCITRPLEDIGLTKEEIFEPATLRELSEIHNLTAGRPYEIQLLCHCMFRKVQRGEAKRMRLNLDALDDVLVELRSGQDIYSRPVIAGVRALDKEQLGLLRRILVMDGHASFEQLWFIEHVIKGVPLGDRDVLLDQLRQFESSGLVVRKDGGVIHFGGDDFDAIYCKYFARHAFDIGLYFSRFPVELYSALLLEDTLHPCGRGDGLFQMNPTADVESTAREQELIFNGFKLHDPAVFDSANPLVRELYRQMIDGPLGEAEQIVFARIHLRGPAFSLAHPAVFGGLAHMACFAKLAGAVVEMSERADRLGGEVSLVLLEGTVWSRAELIAAAAAYANDVTLARLVALHAGGAVRAYMSGDGETAINDANAVLELGGASEWNALNNVGYILIASGNFSEARVVLESAVELSADDERALCMYNLSVACCRDGEIDLAAGWADEALICAEHYAGNPLLCLWVPQIGESGIEWIEAQQPDLLTSAESLVRVLTSYSAKSAG